MTDRKSIIANNLMNFMETEKRATKDYVKMRRKLFQTYAIVGALFSGIGVAGYYDSVAEEWIELREAYLTAKGRTLSRTAIDLSKFGACAGVMHSMAAIVVVVIGLAYMGRIADSTGMTDFMLNSKVWFFGYGTWDSQLAMVVNANLCMALFCFSVAAVTSVFNRVDNPYTYVIGFYSLPIAAYGIYFMHITLLNWNRGFAATALLEKRSLSLKSENGRKQFGSMLHLSDVHVGDSDGQETRKITAS